MALLYDSFGVRRVMLEANFWPNLPDFHPGELSRLYAHLNSHDTFASCELHSLGARFEGEQWVYDISTTDVALRCYSYETPDQLRSRIRGLLEGTRQFFADQHRLAFYVTEVRMIGIVPEDKDRHVGEVVRKRLLTRLKPEDLEVLDGLQGAGLRLVGDTDDFHWHANIEPPHGSYGVLGLTAELMFGPGEGPPKPDEDLDRIDEQVQAAYTFLNDQVREFASKLFH